MRIAMELALGESAEQAEVILPQSLPNDLLPKVDIAHIINPGAPGVVQVAQDGRLTEEEDPIPPRRRDPKNRVIQTRWKRCDLRRYSTEDWQEWFGGWSAKAWAYHQSMAFGGKWTPREWRRWNRNWTHREWAEWARDHHNHFDQ